MNLFRFLKRRGSAPVARDRLQILLAYERSALGSSDLLITLREEILAAELERLRAENARLLRLLKLTPGSILELNRAADAPVELLVNNKLIAKGEVVVVDGNFAFRTTEIESPAARIRSLG